VAAMDNSIHFQSRVGDDGVLNIQLNLGAAEAKRDVKITIEPVISEAGQQPEAMSWPDFVERTPMGRVLAWGWNGQSRVRSKYVSRWHDLAARYERLNPLSQWSFS
jgi:hypothetical protein